MSSLTSPILVMGESSLSEPSVAVADCCSPETKHIIQQLKTTMQVYNGAGLAAPQIGYNQRIIVLGVNNNPRYPDQPPIPFRVLINPEIVSASTDMVEGWEGCLSLPKMRGLIRRSFSIEYIAQNEQGDYVHEVVTGFHARIIQHEIDHLDGVLLVQRVDNFKHFGFEEVLWEKIYGVPYSKPT